MALKLNLKFKLDLNSLPKAVRIAIALLPAALVAGIVTFVSIMPANKTINDLKTKIAAQEAEISKSQSMADRLEDLIKQNEMLKQKLIELQQQLPEEKEISVILKQVSDLGIDAGLQILSWKPATRKNHSSGIVYEVPVGVEFRGTYHQLGHFFSSLTALDRIVNIANLKLASPTLVGDQVVLSITFVSNTYTAISEKGLVDTGEKPKDDKAKAATPAPATPAPAETTK